MLSHPTKSDTKRPEQVCFIPRPATQPLLLFNDAGVNSDTYFIQVGNLSRDAVAA